MQHRRSVNRSSRHLGPWTSRSSRKTPSFASPLILIWKPSSATPQEAAVLSKSTYSSHMRYSEDDLLYPCNILPSIRTRQSGDRRLRKYPFVSLLPGLGFGGAIPSTILALTIRLGHARKTRALRAITPSGWTLQGHHVPFFVPPSRFPLRPDLGHLVYRTTLRPGGYRLTDSTVVGALPLLPGNARQGDGATFQKCAASPGCLACHS